MRPASRLGLTLCLLSVAQHLGLLERDAPRAHQLLELRQERLDLLWYAVGSSAQSPTGRAAWRRAKCMSRALSTIAL